VGSDIPVDSNTFLVTDFVNLKIKPTQFFRCAHRGRIYMCVFIELSVHTYMNIYVCSVFLKKGLYRDQVVCRARTWQATICDQNLIFHGHQFWSALLRTCHNMKYCSVDYRKEKGLSKIIIRSIITGQIPPTCYYLGILELFGELTLALQASANKKEIKCSMMFGKLNI
jgi:hypothetical protein